ncbi:MAG: NYN domain-containing protein, partial [Acidimicrobiia bacterium]
TLVWPTAMGGGQVVHPQTGLPFEIIQQKAVDVGLAFHLMRSFARRGWRKLFLAAGDGDFHEVVQHLVEQENVRVYLIGTMSSISEELRPYATRIIELDKIAAGIARPRTTSPTPPPAPPPPPAQQLSPTGEPPGASRS